MIWLIDTNILLRLVQIADIHHTEAKNAVDKLLAQNFTLCILLQNVSEFWNVCTRPLDKKDLDFRLLKLMPNSRKSNQFSTFCPTRKKFIETGAS